MSIGLHHHHIIPKHAGGTDDESNLEWVTPEVHAERHRVLWETHHRIEDKIAWLALSGQTEEFEKERVQLVKNKLTGVPKSAEHRAKISAALKGRKRASRPSHRKGKRLPKEHADKVRLALKRVHAAGFTEDHRRKLSEAKRGKNNPNYGRKRQTTVTFGA